MVEGKPEGTELDFVPATRPGRARAGRRQLVGWRPPAARASPGGWKRGASDERAELDARRDRRPARRRSSRRPTGRDRPACAIEQVVADPDRVEPAPPPPRAPSLRLVSPRDPFHLRAAGYPRFMPRTPRTPEGRAGTAVTSAIPDRRGSSEEHLVDVERAACALAGGAVDRDRVFASASARCSSLRYVPPVRRRVSRKSSKISSRPDVLAADRRGPGTRQTASLGDHLDEHARVAAGERTEDAAEPPTFGWSYARAARASGRAPSSCEW